MKALNPNKLASASGGGAVQSVNTLTGAVSLGVEDLDDFALNPGTFPYWATKEGTGTPSAGEWYANGTDFMRANPVDSNGTDWSTEMTALGTTGTFWHSTDGTNWTSTTNSGGFDNLPTWFQFNLSPFNVNPHTGGLYISFSDPASAPSTALADGDILQYVSADSKFKPAQAAGVRSLLGIEEYVDDAAAGTGGLSSGELYYNTTSSSYVLKA